MKEKGKISALSIMILFLFTGNLSAKNIAIQLTAEITWIDDYDNLLEGRVNIGDILTGSYIYNSDTPDNNPMNSMGAYWHYRSTYGIRLGVGGFVFQTDPDNVKLLLGIDNGTYGYDTYHVISYNNLPLSNGVEINHILWQLDDYSGAALSSDALPTTPPVLGDWEDNYLLITLGYKDPSGIQARVTSAVRVPAIIFVDADSTGENDGSNWADAFNDLQDALAVSESGDEIRVAQGIYKPGPPGPPGPPPPPPPPPPGPPPPANPRSATFQLKNGVVIKGGYAGFGEPDPDARDINVYETVLSGDLAGNDVDLNDLSDLWDEPSRADNSLHVVTGSGTNETALMDGFTITAGNDNRYGPPPVPNYPPLRLGYGAGMCNYSGSPTLANCTFIRNTANGKGGGMYNGDQSSPTLTNCIFSENSAAVGGAMYTEESSPSLVNCTFNGNLATGSGGGMCNYESEPTLTGCTFIGNSTSDGIFNEGGGIYNYSSSTNITNCTFIGNSARDKGGALYIAGISNQSLNITNCTFIRNSAFRWGGAVYTGYTNGISNQTLTNCIFIDNSAKYFGGAMVIEHCNPTLINCTFRNNKTESSGGGITCGNASSTLINCEFIGNVAQEYGGGMYNRVSSSPTLWNCTFTGNSADDIGGGIYNIENSNPTLTNCIIWGNEARDGPEIAIVEGSDPSMITVSYCDTQGGEQDIYVGPGCALIWGEGNIDADPWFVDPGYWGNRDDPNIVVEPNDPNALWVCGDYHLLTGSPCINAGDPNYVAGPNETDLDGKPRIFGCQIDMGAFEYMRLVPAEVRFVPHNINLANKGRWITCYIRLPESYNIADIDFCILLLEDEIQPEQFWFNEENKVVAAMFNHEQLQGILDIGAVELTITAKLTNGTVFEGTDIIKVIYEGGGKLADYGNASNPNPYDGAKGVSVTADLSWTAGSKATSHDVYFGTSSTPPFVCNQIDTTFDPGTMDYETTYYWSIDEVSKWGKTTGDIWSFTTPPPPPVLNASDPNPADKATSVSIYTDLSWTAGYDATSHDVYFGTSNPPPFVCTQTDTTYNPGLMDYSTTYYWRIDEVNDSSTTPGEIWKFTTMIPPPPPP